MKIRSPNSTISTPTHTPQHTRHTTHTHTHTANTQAHTHTQIKINYTLDYEMNEKHETSISHSIEKKNIKLASSQQMEIRNPTYKISTHTHHSTHTTPYTHTQAHTPT